MRLNTRFILWGLLGLFSLVFLIVLRLGYYSIILPSLFAIFGLVIFIIGDWLSKPSQNENDAFELHMLPFRTDLSFPVFSWSLNVLFFLFYSFSLLSLFQGNYSISATYYLCISICTAILIAAIFLSVPGITRYIILFEIFLLTLNIVFSNHLIFINGISQPDFGLHYMNLIEILLTGHITSNATGYYNIFSIHHIFASEVALLTGYNSQSVYLLLGSFILAIGVLFVFVIGKRFVNFNFGLVAAVLFTCLDFYLMSGEHPEHVAYGFGFAVISFTIILFTYRIRSTGFYFLFAVSSVSIILTHHLTAVIVFVTICSLVLIDFFYAAKIRRFFLPSKEIFAFFAIFLFVILIIVSGNNAIQLIITVFKPYFTNAYLLIEQFFNTHVTTITAPVGSISGISTPNISNPNSPTTAISSSLYSPQTGYDKLSILTLFINTLGSSILVLLSMLGFCFLLKKRSWFGDYVIINTILLSFLLGIGILFPVVVFIPDRMYPAIQIFCLVFLGAFGIFWIRNSTPASVKPVIIVSICILVALMSFFSLASTINGFETSLFVDKNLAYPKLYKTSQDVSFDTWNASFIQNDKQKILALPFNYNGLLDVVKRPGDTYYIFDRTLLKTGKISTTTGIFGQVTFIHINEESLLQLNAFSTYYDNGLISVVVPDSLEKT